MRLSSSLEVKAFEDTVKACTGDVWLVDPDRNEFNLKSRMSRYIAIAELIHNEGNRLELFCGNDQDEGRFYELFAHYPAVLG